MFRFSYVSASFHRVISAKEHRLNIAPALRERL